MHWTTGCPDKQRRKLTPILSATSRTSFSWASASPRQRRFSLLGRRVTIAGTDTLAACHLVTLSLVLAASEFGLQSRTGGQRGVGRPGLEWFARVYWILKRGLSGRSTTWCSRETSSKLAKALGIDTLDTHGKILQKYRTLDEIQKRGRWKSQASMVRYEKSSRVVADNQKIPDSVRPWTQKACVSLVHIVQLAQRCARHTR